MEELGAAQLVDKSQLPERSEVPGGRPLLATVQHRGEPGSARVHDHCRRRTNGLAARVVRVGAGVQVPGGRAAAGRQPGRRENRSEHQRTVRKWYVF